MIYPVQPVILCGGSGTRLWPLSRAGFPKQFLCLTGTNSLFQQAVLRMKNYGMSPYIVSNEIHRFLAQEQLREIGVNEARFLLEPSARNTAPALTLAALAALDEGVDPVLVVTPADHSVTDLQSFDQALLSAIADATQGHIVVLGVTPDKPETGYGYIKAAPTEMASKKSDCGFSSSDSKQVLGFVEKPNIEIAQKYLLDSNYFWNSGIFILKASVWLNALRTFRPDIAEACQEAWSGKRQDGQFIRPDKVLFEQVPSESVDYAVLEKCPGSIHSVRMVPLSANWSDLGAWDAVWKAIPKDLQGNSNFGDVISHNTRNTLVHATGRLVALVGVDNLVVVETADAVLVASMTQSQDVRHIVNMLSTKQREELTLHRKVHRPWGWYDCIDEGGRFKVKRIQVKPKSSISLQKHHHRAEHWIVVTGTAVITNGSQILTLTENQSTYIQRGEIHRLSNPGLTLLEIIEIQSGGYLGEDDIVRFEDNYGRLE